jgi:hypothetical protein
VKLLNKQHGWDTPFLPSHMPVSMLI